MASRFGRIGGFALAFAAVLATDQLTKALARDRLAEAGSVTLVPGVMDLRLVFNEGAAFSFGEGYAWVFVAIAAVVAAACFAYVLLGSPGRALSCVLGAVAGGGVGNLIDRVSMGCVTDFFMPTFVDFAVFNVADIALTCGFVLAIALWWREDLKRERQRAERAAQQRPNVQERGGTEA